MKDDRVCYKHYPPKSPLSKGDFENSVLGTVENRNRVGASLTEYLLYHVRLDRTYNLSSPLTPNIGGKFLKVPSPPLVPPSGGETGGEGAM